MTKKQFRSVGAELRYEGNFLLGRGGGERRVVERGIFFSAGRQNVHAIARNNTRWTFTKRLIFVSHHPRFPTSISTPFNPQTESIDGEVFRPRERIKTQADFNRVGRFGKNFNGKHLRVQWLSNEGVAGDGGSVVTNTRLGIKTPKKQIKRAVDRNLVKRRVRDVFRKNKESWPTGVDMVVYCTAATLTSSYEEMKLEMKYWGKEVVPRVAERGGTEAGGAFGAGKKKPWKKRETAQPAAVSGRKIFKNSEGPQESKSPETGVCAPPEGKEKTAGKRGKGTAVATAEE